MIALVDYGLGNIRAFANIYKRMGLDVMIAQTPTDITKAKRLILPGVGSFDWAMRKLNKSGMRDALDYAVLEQKVNVLGVCVGMQMMADGSEEGSENGLGWIGANVVKFDSKLFQTPALIPHMGWNDAEPVESGGLFLGMDKPRFYFLHSYFLALESDELVASSTFYGEKFTSSVRSNNIFGTQFHPEKSHQWGVSLLSNFARV